jgi:hypothetical protein
MTSNAAFRVSMALLGAFLFAVDAAGSTALQIKLQVDAGTPVTITDSNDPNAGDSNVEDQLIDFSTTVDGVLEASGHVVQFNGVRTSIDVAPDPNGVDAVFRNLDPNAPHTFTVTVDSATFTTPPAPLGWFIGAAAMADDPNAGDVEVPQNDVAGFYDPDGTGFVALPMGSVSAPVTPPVPVIDQPARIDEFQRFVDDTPSAVRLRFVWTFIAGPSDEIRLHALDGDSVSFDVFNPEQLCVVKTNKFATKVATAAGKVGTVCIKDGQDVSCVDDGTSTKVVSAATKLVDFFAKVCESNPPAFGANTGFCCFGGTVHAVSCTGTSDPNCPCTAGACMSGAAADAAAALAHDLFGPTGTVSCRSAVGVLGTAEKVLAARWKFFTKCKQKNIRNLTQETDFVSTCLGPPQPDASGKIAKAEAKIAKTVDKAAQECGSLSTTFPGACAGQSTADYAGCIAHRVACRFCLGAVIADDITAPLDCDAFANDPNVECPG